MRRHRPEVLRTPVGIVGVTLLTVLVLLAVLAPLLWGDRATATNTGNMLAGPSPEHWAGTDNLGRDILFRTLVATRLSLVLTLVATTLGVGLGLLLGLAPLLLPQRLGRLVVAFVNVLLGFPSLLMVLFLAVILGVSTTSALLAIGIAIAPPFARLVHALGAGVTERDFVAAARIAGVPPARIMVRHVLPNVAEPLVVNATVTASSVLLAFGGLSFLGIGVQAPQYDWGRLMQDGLAIIYDNPLAALAPGIAFVLTGLAFNLTGEAAAGTFGAKSRSRMRWPAPASPRPGTRDDADLAADRDGLVLDVRDLAVTFPGPDGPIPPVRGVSIALRAGEAVGVVGESGSGKSMTALAVAQLVEEPGRVTAERLAFCATDLRSGRRAAHDALLGTSLAVVFQDPMTSLNPVLRVGTQLGEAARRHQGLTRRQASARAADRLRAVHLAEPERRLRQYPHEFSGGMRQRAMIAMGLMGTPRLIVADEPTTALDMTVQRQVLDVLQEVRREHGTALLLISHDVSVVSSVCDRVLVMYAGRIVEDLPSADLHTQARHPYTRALIGAVPDMTTDLDAPLATIAGQPVDPRHVPDGCAFAARCPLVTDRCRQEEPTLQAGPVGAVACWHVDDPIPAETEEVAVG
ncbi:ATP-binding cassette domain-containing protein [Pimelobacter simplex]|uniref:Oligopeptide transport system permease protein OppB n=1 Tax=Nocardioides simplex TaxID=2045 RepID=A0A0A1DV44_NOCSI|nr:dipeptide/oligopeptide/nickel ABC transporter permease/ATP-binding protein [Pimelobacter simplex]AIY19300.1 Oligopeptide transport system permease protein OppB [Pimelobacter simplex]MCG8149410.1 ATP-binding cassette domain-containing protein [Pimelobacter simplex]GEB16219.1 peptide ABC transporter ATP-binding protein [Pimelobacter simplex]SFM19472.1 oligopeptide/dipeptide ABC transporter, ATP-binding protein, C-terminal domain-containing protein [Pimelobacter simplex]